ncbi:3-deoxy-D-manno-octulosonic acid transferase [Acetobacteraceae bacterium H6797]|nr:3-deoxy-D-manno-octulosonic acid transferase [Acetobacteraceae bacterium H6797]
MSLTLSLWRGLITLAVPVLRANLRRRAEVGKEEPARLPEREGFGAARPEGPLFWLHAASVGESQSILPLLGPMLAARPGLTILITTGSVTSAKLLRERLPRALARRVIHRFVPLDVPAWVNRFLDGWQPDAAAFVDSEIWPSLLSAAHRRAIPMALVNARMSDRSAGRWGRMRGLARALLGPFRLVLAKSPEDAARFAALGAPRVEAWGNLKSAAAPLPVKQAELARLKALLAGRPVALAASTHPGEEAMMMAAHRRLLPRFPNLLTIIAPRHPHRGEAIAADAGGLPITRRALNQDPPSGPGIWLMDTLGELGLGYRLADVALVGGSLVPHGGQNPLEPARLGCPILLGPHTGNFAETAAELLGAGGARLVPDAAMLAPCLADVLSDATLGGSMAAKAAELANEGAGLPERVAAALIELLPRP